MKYYKNIFNLDLLKKILITSIFVCFYLMNYAQSYNFNTRVESFSSVQKPLSDIINEIAKKENLHLAYESGLLKNKYCSFNANDLPFKKALDLIFSETDLEYIITKDKQLLIRKRKENNPEVIKLIGQIKDKQSKNEVPFASISLEGAKIGSYADEFGRFDLIIPSDYINGNDTIIIHRIGYLDKKIELNEFINNTDIELDIKTRVLPILTIVSPLNKINNLYSLSTYNTDNQQLNVSSIVSSDILRNLQFLPSVYANKDNSAKLNIRGSKAYETLVLIDGLRIYNPTHFYNVFSSINSDYVKEVIFYKNSAPPNLRSMTGGVVEMNSYPLQNNCSADISANLMYLSTSIKMPLSDKFGINISARKSIFNTVKQSFIGDVINSNNPILQNDRILNSRGDKNNPGFKFYDYNSKIVYKLSDSHKLFFNLYKSVDNYEDKFATVIRKNAIDKSFLKFVYRDFSNWENTGMGIKYAMDYNKIKTTVALSAVQYQEKNQLNINLIKKRKDSIRMNSIVDSRYSSVNDIVFKIDNKITFDKNRNTKFGIDFTSYGVSSQINVRKKSIFNIANNFNSYTFYGSYYQSFNRFNFDISLKSSYYSGTKTNYFDPGMVLEYKFAENISLYGSFNINHLYLRQFDYETPQSKNTSFWVLSNESIPVLSSKVFSLGGKHTVNHSKLILEGYYKTQDGLSILLKTRLNSNPLSKTDFAVFNGDSYNYGIDLMWIYNYKKYFSRISYTYSIFNQRFDRVFKNKYHPAPNDTRHQLKWIQNYKVGNWLLGLNFIYSSGTPYFDFRKLDKDSHRGDILFEDYIKLLPYYFRSDISINYDFEILDKKTQLFFTIYNLTNRVNITERKIITPAREPNSQNALEPIQSQSSLLSRTLNIGFKLKL